MGKWYVIKKRNYVSKILTYLYLKAKYNKTTY